MLSGQPKELTYSELADRQQEIADVVEACGVSYLWLIGSRARGDNSDVADWDWMFSCWDYDTRKHERLESKLSTVAGVKSSCVLVSHVVRYFTSEEAEAVVKHCIPVVRAGRWVLTGPQSQEQ